MTGRGRNTYNSTSDTSEYVSDTLKIFLENKPERSQILHVTTAS